VASASQVDLTSQEMQVMCRAEQGKMHVQDVATLAGCPAPPGVDRNRAEDSLRARELLIAQDLDREGITL
jgi:hypothetical protein